MTCNECQLPLVDGRCLLNHSIPETLKLNCYCTVCQVNAELVNNEYVCPMCGVWLDSKDMDTINIEEMRGYSGQGLSIVEGDRTIYTNKSLNYTYYISQEIQRLLFTYKLSIPKEIQMTSIEYFIMMLKEGAKDRDQTKFFYRGAPKIALLVVCLYYAFQEHHTPYSLYDLTKNLNSDNTLVTKAQTEFKKVFKICTDTIDEEISELTAKYGLQGLEEFIRRLYDLTIPRNVGGRTYRPNTRLPACVYIAGICTRKLDKKDIDDKTKRFLNSFLKAPWEPFRETFEKYGISTMALR